jgi:hypothetical protein
MAIAGRKAQVRVAGAAVAITNEPTTDQGGGVFQITNAAKRVLDRTATLTARYTTDNVTFTATTPSFVNRLTGQFTFLGLPAGASVQVTGSYLPMSVVAEAKEYGYTMTAKNQDSSRLGDTYVKRDQTLKDVTGSIGQWTSTDRYFENALTAETVVVLDLYADSSAAVPDLRCWALVSKTEMKAAMDGLVETSVSFEGTPDLDGRMISVV